MGLFTPTPAQGGMGGGIYRAKGRDQIHQTIFLEKFIFWIRIAPRLRVRHRPIHRLVLVRTSAGLQPNRRCVLSLKLKTIRSFAKLLADAA